MKKVSFLFVLVLAFAMTFVSSCSNDDNDSPNPVTATVEGKWNFSKMSTVLNGVPSAEEDYDDNEPGCPKDFIELKSGGVYNDGDYYNSECQLETSTGTWSKSGSIITITGDGISIPLEVVSVSNTVLKVKYSDTFEGITTVINITFTKA
jgi:hypothetical protein